MKTYLWMLWAALVLTMGCCVSSCSDEQEPEDESGDTLELLSCSRTVQDAEGTRAVTVPEGYEPFTTQYPEISTESTTIGLYLAGTTVSSLRRIVYETDHWRSEAKVKEDNDYYIYGFVPVEVASVSSVAGIGSDFSQGATLSLSGLKVLTDKDVCVVVGVQGAASAAEDVSVAQGNFSYVGKAKGQNYVYLLFDHIYSAVQFSIRVDDTYAALRTIRLKSVVLKTDATAVADVDVVLQPREQNTISSVSMTAKGTAKGEFVLLDRDQSLTTTYESLGNTCYFLANARGSMQLVSTYDVYDRYGKLVREDCTSENKLDILAAAGRGQKRNLKLTVAPTYLYQLSDDDLDNPTFRIEN